jgi:hypothetical protein
MPIDSWRELVGPYALTSFVFGLAEASVAADAVLLPGNGAAGVVAVPVGHAGHVVGIYVSSEASAAFTLKVTIDGTANDTAAVTVAGLNAETTLRPGQVTFTAAQVLGVKVSASTTAKDVAVHLLVALNVI